MKGAYKLSAFFVLIFLDLSAQSIIKCDSCERNYIFNSDSVSNRADQSSAIILDNGEIAVAFSRFGNSWLDTASSSIYVSKSGDGGYNWGEGVELIASISLGSYIPSFYRKSNGNIICVFFVRETAVPSYTSTLRQIEFDGNLENIVEPVKIIYRGGYNPIASDRLFYDSDNDLLLFPYPILVNGTGHSTVSVYDGGLLISKDEGDTWVDSGLLLKGSLDLKGYGGCMEPGLFKHFDNLGYYCRTTLGNVQYSKLIYTGKAPSYYSSSPFVSIGVNAQNAQSSVKYLEGMNLFVASYTEENVSNPLVFDRQSMGVSVSENGLDWAKVFSLDSVSNSEYQINSVNIYEDRVSDNLIFFYSISPSSGFFDLVCKVVSLVRDNVVLSVKETGLITKGVFGYPNPSSDFIYISGLKNKEEYEIFNSLGIRTLKGTITNDEKVEIKSLSRGVYFLRLSNGKIVKFVKS